MKLQKNLDFSVLISDCSTYLYNCCREWYRDTLSLKKITLFWKGKKLVLSEEFNLEHTYTHTRYQEVVLFSLSQIDFDVIRYLIHTSSSLLEGALHNLGITRYFLRVFKYSLTHVTCFYLIDWLLLLFKNEISSPLFSIFFFIIWTYTIEPRPRN